MSDETCKTCNGNGKTPTINDSYMICFECKSLGTIAKTENKETCKTCKGEGIIKNKLTINNEGTKYWEVDCTDCKGLGTLAKSEYQSTKKRNMWDDPMIDEMMQRIEKLEFSSQIKTETFVSVIERIEKLEERQKFLDTNWQKIHRLEKEIDKLDDEKNRIWEVLMEEPKKREDIVERIEEIEDKISSLEHNISAFGSGIFKRIEKLEKEISKEIKIPTLPVVRFETDDMATLSEKVERLEKVIETGMLHNDLRDLIHIMKERINDLEEWTRKDEDNIYVRIEKIENQELNNHSIRIGALEKEVFINMQKIFKKSEFSDDCHRAAHVITNNRIENLESSKDNILISGNDNKKISELNYNRLLNYVITVSGCELYSEYIFNNICETAKEIIKEINNYDR